MITEKQVNKVYNNLIGATALYHMAVEEQALAKQTFETAKAIALASGDIEGKNQQLRDSAAIEHFPGHWEQYQLKDKALTSARNNLELARLESERIRLIVRLMELPGALYKEAE